LFVTVLFQNQIAATFGFLLRREDENPTTQLNSTQLNTRPNWTQH